jgi:CheY-like chemotaxis protein
MSRTKKQATEAAVREIRRRTRRKFAPEEKIRIVLEGLRGEENLAAFYDEMSIGRSAEQHGANHVATTLDCRILLAEDASTVQLLVGRILHVAGAEVVTVSTGLEAIAAASNEKFDLIVMDIDMPDMNGDVATQALRAMGTQVPIIAFTGHDGEEFRSHAMSVGFTGVLRKQVNRESFVKAIASFLA